LVKAGDALFDMDTTAARSRQAVARSSFDAAAEEYRQTAQLALTEDKGKLDLATRQARVEEKRVELDYSRDMLDRVLVKAPRAGVAVFSDENEWQGKAVTVGERVLTLADPAKVELTIYLPVADAIELAPDAGVVFYPNGTAFASHDASLSSAAYRAELSHEGVLAYRLKAHLDGAGTPPRIGAVGTAKVYGGWAPLIYHALRRPLVAARQWAGI
jgi:multidrug resistance efflux pump